jgi:hypothetical protein
MSMTGVNGGGLLGNVKVITTNGRGLNVEELADLALRKLIYIGDNAPPELADQARQFKEQIRVVLIRYMHQAIVSDRTTLWNNLKGAGYKEVADIILKI